MGDGAELGDDAGEGAHEAVEQRGGGGGSAHPQAVLSTGVHGLRLELNGRAVLLGDCFPIAARGALRTASQAVVAGPRAVDGNLQDAVLQAVLHP